MNAAKANRRAIRRELIRKVERSLQTTVWSKGVAGFCEGARPRQIRAGAKVIVDQHLAYERRLAMAEVGQP